jgi:hypothetical protein
VFVNQLERPYETKIPPRSAINTRCITENNNLSDPRNDDKSSLCDMHTQLYLLQVVNVEFHHFRNLSRLCFVESRMFVWKVCGCLGNLQRKEEEVAVLIKRANK